MLIIDLREIDLILFRYNIMFVLSKQRDLYNTFLPTPGFPSLLSHFSSISKLERFHVAFRLSSVQSIQSHLSRGAGGLRGRQQFGVDILDLDTGLVICLAICKTYETIRNYNCDKLDILRQ